MTRPPAGPPWACAPWTTTPSCRPRSPSCRRRVPTGKTPPATANRSRGNAPWHADALVGLAGDHLQHTLLHGRSVAVDDRVVTASARGLCVGKRLLQAVRQQTRQLQAHHLVLDTGLHMALAQRFDVRQGLLARGLHLVEPL